MKVIIAGGGTGGHLFPGIAVAEELIERQRSGGDGVRKSDIVFVGTDHGIEARAIPREGYNLRIVRAAGLVGKSLADKIRAAFMVLLSLADSFRILKSIKPNVVIGVGGYASVGAVLAARLKGIPTMVLEQNSVSGLANRFLGRFADAVCVTYQESMASFPQEKTYLTGNPIRKTIMEGSHDRAYAAFPLERDRFTVLIFGGSLGARSINRALIDALHYLSDLRQNIQFLHQTGPNDYESVREAYRRFGFNGVVVPFIHAMAEAYAVADVVLCRAGATTLSELTAIGKPAVLVPYPHAAANHQEYNARKLESMGAARMIRDRELNGESLSGMLRELYANVQMRREMQKSAAAFGRVDAASRVADMALSLARK